MPDPVLVSIQVGLPRVMGTPDAADPLLRPWTSAFDKRPVAGAIRLGRLGLEGDGHADLRHHGGPERAALGYSADHYPRWRAELGLSEMPGGGFGENLTLAGLTEESVSIGETHAIGEAVLQVSTPRAPCGNISRFWQRKDLTSRVRATGRTGWYYRVLREGAIEAGTEVGLEERPFPGLTVALVNRLLRSPEADPETVTELARCPLLSEAWRAEFAEHARSLGKGRRA